MKLVCITTITFLLFTCALSIQPESTAFANQQETGQSTASTSTELTEASTLSKEVVKLYGEKKYDKAMPMAKRALEIRRRLLGKEDPLIADALLNLGALYIATRKNSDAMEMYKEALDIYETAYGPESGKLISVLDDLGWFSYADGKNFQATEIFNLSLSIREKVYGPDHEQTAHGLLNIGRFHQNIAEYDKSLVYYQRALDIKEKALGADHKDLVDILEQCSCAYLQVNQRAKAQALQTRAYSIKRKGADRKTIFSGFVLPSEAEHRETPHYPQQARKAGVKGTVVVEITIDESGNVIKAEHKCGPALLAQASIEAARKWRFKPTITNSSPVKVVGTISFTFNR